MNYKLIEDKNGTIVINEKRYKMSKLEYTKDDLIDIQNDYDLLYKKLDHYNKIINTQALEIARLKEKIKRRDEFVKEQQQRIDKAIEYIKECTNSPDIYERFISTGETKKLLEILGDKYE